MRGHRSCLCLIWILADCLCCDVPVITVILNLNFHFAFCGAQLNKARNFPTAYYQKSPSPTQSMTITIHQGSDVEGPIAGLLNRSASKLLFNVSHNSPKQSGLLSISHARPFKVSVIHDSRRTPGVNGSVGRKKRL